MTNKMWGGRFASAPDAVMEEINASIGFDQRLFAQDIKGSLAHARMLAEKGIISKSDAAEIRRGLEKVQAEIEAGTIVRIKANPQLRVRRSAELEEEFRKLGCGVSFEKPAVNGAAA